MFIFLNFLPSPPFLLLLHISTHFMYMMVLSLSLLVPPSRKIPPFAYQASYHSFRKEIYEHMIYRGIGEAGIYYRSPTGN
jgi:hypothetical protein